MSIEYRHYKCDGKLEKSKFPKTPVTNILSSTDRMSVMTNLKTAKANSQKTPKKHNVYNFTFEKGNYGNYYGTYQQQHQYQQ